MAAGTGTQAVVTAATGGVAGSLTMEVMTIEFQATPLRATRFIELYGPAAARVLAYGASSYLFYRSVDDPDHFTHISFWENRSDFERYWFSPEVQEVRQQLFGYYEQPVLPHWGVIYGRG